MTRTTALAAALALAALTAAPSHGQDLSGITPWGVEVSDGYGNSVFVDPYSGQVYTDAYGQPVVTNSSYVDPNAGYNAYNPYASGATYNPYANTYNPYAGVNSYDPYASTNTSSYLDANPYANPSNSHESFLEMIWE